MSGVAITYKGATIASMSDSGNKTLGTAGKYCEDDISVAYTATPEPSGTKQISVTQNGTLTENVSGYASVEVTTVVPNGRTTVTATVTDSDYIEFPVTSPGDWKNFDLVCLSEGDNFSGVRRMTGSRTHDLFIAYAGYDYTESLQTEVRFAAMYQTSGAYTDSEPTQTYNKIWTKQNAIRILKTRIDGTSAVAGFTRGKEYSLTLYY
ncbi:MAG: hypothetical protein IJS41_01435 [Clostridia bacterium]|nr:hypothetical protein [Clostridia bacterium]